MRWLIRLVVVWAVTLPLFYLFGLPYLLGALETKARAQSVAQCRAHLKSENMAYVPAAIMKPARADAYCHCISDPIRFTRADVLALALKKPPERLNNALKPAIEACNTALQNDMNNAISSSQPRSTFDANGVETVHFH